jgi:uncharacterized protein YjbI with pentapeptide repeats
MQTETIEQILDTLTCHDSVVDGSKAATIRQGIQEASRVDQGRLLEKAVRHAIPLHGILLPNLIAEDRFLTGAMMRGAQLDLADLRGAKLRGADLKGASLRHAILAWADLSHANLEGVDFTRADLSSADLRNANLRNADLTWAHVCNADFRGADLRNAHLPIHPAERKSARWRKAIRK